VFPCPNRWIGADLAGRIADQAAILAKRL